MGQVKCQSQIKFYIYEMYIEFEIFNVKQIMLLLEDYADNNIHRIL